MFPGTADTELKDVESSPTWQAFVSGLADKGFFEGEPAGSQAHRQLMLRAACQFRGTLPCARHMAAVQKPAHRVLDLLRDGHSFDPSQVWQFSHRLKPKRCEPLLAVLTLPRSAASNSCSYSDPSGNAFECIRETMCSLGFSEWDASGSPLDWACRSLQRQRAMPGCLKEQRRLSGSFSSASRRWEKAQTVLMTCSWLRNSRFACHQSQPSALHLLSKLSFARNQKHPFLPVISKIVQRDP